jgi:hypothetical protein
MELTQIQVSKVTRGRLQALGVKGDSYDAIINRVLDKLEYYMVKK